MAQQIDCEYVTPEAGEVWLEDLALKVGGLRAHTFTFATPTTMTITRTVTPWWAIVIAVLLFPLGLIALIVKTTKTATIMARPLDDGTSRVHLVGSTSRALREKLYTVMPVDALAPASPQPVRVGLLVKVAVLVGVGILVVVVVAATLK